MTAPELFARVWHVGLALTPLLVTAALLARRPGRPNRRHALAIAILAGLTTSCLVPVAADPGPLLTSARREFRDTGLAPCLPSDPTAAEPTCLAYRWGAPWLLGVALLLAWQVLGLLTVRTLRTRGRSTTPADDAEVLAAAIAIGVHPPTVLMHDRASSPMVAGWRRPVLLLPLALWRRLDQAAREAILLHELAHLRRRDVLTLPLMSVVCAVFWWHPVVWWLRRLARRAAELASDRLAAQTRPECARALATALLEVERYATTQLLPTTAARAWSPGAHELAQRLRELLATDERRPPAVAPWLPGAAFAIALAMGSAVIQIVLQ